MTYRLEDLRSVGVTDRGLRLRAYRYAWRGRAGRRLTLREVAVRIGISTTTLHKLELGKRVSRADVLAQIDQFLDREARGADAASAMRSGAYVIHATPQRSGPRAQGVPA